MGAENIIRRPDTLVTGESSYAVDMVQRCVMLQLAISYTHHATSCKAHCTGRQPENSTQTSLITTSLTRTPALHAEARGRG